MLKADTGKHREDRQTDGDSRQRAGEANPKEYEGYPSINDIYLSGSFLSGNFLIRGSLMERKILQLPSAFALQFAMTRGQVRVFYRCLKKVQSIGSKFGQSF
jgi:hypothetical protein